jgi:hypothetical protein
MAFPRWVWQSVQAGTPWKEQAWVLFNQRLKGLENFLGGVQGLVLGRRTVATNADAPIVTLSGSLILRNTSATTISEFTGGEPGQVIVILALDNQTTLQHGGNIRLNGNVDWVVLSGETRQFYTPDGTTWYEVPRSLTTAEIDTLATEGLDDLVTEGSDLLEVEA